MGASAIALRVLYAIALSALAPLRLLIRVLAYIFSPLLALLRLASQSIRSLLGFSTDMVTRSEMLYTYCGVAALIGCTIGTFGAFAAYGAVGLFDLWEPGPKSRSAKSLGKRAARSSLVDDYFEEDLPSPQTRVNTGSRTPRQPSFETILEEEDEENHDEGHQRYRRQKRASWDSFSYSSDSSG